MRMMELSVSNFQRVDAFFVEPEGNSVVIRGKNTEGKTSVCDAIFACLKVAAIDVDGAVHDGAEQAVITMRLGERSGEEYCTVERIILPDGKTKLKVKPADGSKPGKPQELLNSLLGTYTLDPLAFLGQRPQDILDDILKVFAIEPPITQVSLICNELHELGEGETADEYLARLSADKTGLYYVRRLEIGRECDTVRGAIQKQQDLLTKCEGALLDVDILEKPDVLQEKLTKLREKQVIHDEAKKHADELGATFQAGRDKLGNLKMEEAELRKKLAEVLDRIKKGESVVAKMEKNHAHAVAVLESTEDCSEEISKLNTALTKSISNQDAIISREQATARMIELQEQMDQVLAKHKDQDRILEDLRMLRRDMLAGYDLGIEGLTVEHGELRLNGKPFKKASQAERLKVALAVAMKGGGDLKLLRIDGGEVLDSESRDYVLRLAEENGYQVIMAVVADNAGLEVEIVDQEMP